MSTAPPPLSGRLTRSGPALSLSGAPFAGIGLDIVDLLWNNNTEALEDAASMGVPFVRFAAAPFFPVDLQLWRTDPERYWREGAGAASGLAGGMDAAVAAAKRLRIRLVPDLLWNIFAFADLCHEPLGALFNGSDSCARRAAGDYVSQAAARYRAEPAILFWELSNENNALVDGWFANSSVSCVPMQGTPAHRSDADNFDSAEMIATHSWLSARIRAADPGRLVASGHSFPRRSAEHWRGTPRAEVATHHIDSTLDNRSDFERNLLDINAAVDFVSGHASYGVASMQRPFAGSSATWLLELARAAAASRGQPFYLGEFSASPWTMLASRNYSYASAVVDWVLDVNRRLGGGGGILASVWVFEYKSQNGTFSVIPGRDDELLRKVQLANHILRRGDLPLRSDHHHHQRQQQTAKTDDHTALTTTLQILPPQGPMNQALLGVNWEGVVFGWSYRNQTCPKDCSIGSWVNRSDPLLSTKLVAALKALRVRSLRFPGGTPSNQYDWQNASFVPPAKCINKNEPCPLGGYWDAQRSANELLGKHRRQLSWQRFAVLLDTIGARGVWSLDIVQQTPAQAADALSQLQKALPHHQPLSVELGNEIYGPPGQGNLFPTAQAYLSYVKPILAAQSGGSQLSVTVPPCPAVYTSNNCWGGNTTWLAGFYRNVSSACLHLQGDGHDQSPCPWQQVTAHHYRPRVSAIDCAPYNNCSYRRSLSSVEGTTAASEFGLVDELSQQGAAVTNLTFAAAMIAYPSVTLAAATNNWERDFPGLKLLISEYNADYASTWADHAKAPLGEGGEWMRAAADGGAHALHWAAGVLAGVNSNGIISGINYHSLQGAGRTTKSPGFGILDWNTPGETVKANAVAQLMSHISAIAQNSSMHAVMPGDAMLHVAGIPTGLVIDNQGNLSAMQSAAFSSEDGSLTVVFINRGTRPVDVSIDIGRSGLYQNCVPPPAGLPATLTSYSALDDGGWAEFDPATQTTPWPGPMSAARSQVTVATVSPTVLGTLVAPALSLVVAEIAACPGAES